MPSLFISTVRVLCRTVRTSQWCRVCFCVCFRSLTIWKREAIRPSNNNSKKNWNSEPQNDTQVFNVFKFIQQLRSVGGLLRADISRSHQRLRGQPVLPCRCPVRWQTYQCNRNEDWSYRTGSLRPGLPRQGPGTHTFVWVHFNCAPREMALLKRESERTPRKVANWNSLIGCHTHKTNTTTNHGRRSRRGTLNYGAERRAKKCFVWTVGGKRRYGCNVFRDVPSRSVTK